MSSMYGPRRITFSKKGIIAICGTHKDSKGGTWWPLGRYVTDTSGRTEVYMVGPSGSYPCANGPHDQHLSFIGHANTRLEAKKMILKACQDSRTYYRKDEYVDDEGKIQIKT